MTHTNIEPGEVYTWTEGERVSRLQLQHPPSTYSGRPCQVRGKSPNRSCSVKFANDPTVYRVWSTELHPVKGRTYRTWPPVEPDTITYR